MYCPRCGRQPITDELRFCSYCGFKLAVVKASLADSEEVVPAGLTDVRTLLRQPRSRDTSIGVILMFAGSLLASLMALMDGREAGAITLAIFYLLALLFSGPITKGVFKLFSWDEQGANLSAGRKGMCFGATLMFISTVLLTMGSLMMFGRMRTEPFFISLTLAFVLLLVVSRFLMRGLQYLVTEESTVSLSPSTGLHRQIPEPVFSNLALQAGQDEPIPVFGSQRVQTAEMVSPASITEHTTNLLEKK
jgi:F0F1-type ATP synthase assembly protein I